MSLTHVHGSKKQVLGVIGLFRDNENSLTCCQEDNAVASLDAAFEHKSPTRKSQVLDKEKHKLLMF